MKKTLHLLCAVVLLVASAGAQSQQAGRSSTSSSTRAAQASSAVKRESLKAGFSVERLGRIDTLLKQYVDDNRIGGAVALVLRDGQPVYERAVGWSDKEAGRRMGSDAIFRIASQTKAITTAAILALVEEGKIGINDPV